jgi:hypothetical protein
MSIRAYKWVTGVLACAALFLGWRYFTLSRQMITAGFMSFQCETTENIAAGDPDPAILANRLGFLSDYYRGSTGNLAGSRIYRVVERDYQHTLTSSVAAFRRVTTNDLGSDPSAWIEKYGH